MGTSSRMKKREKEETKRTQNHAADVGQCKNRNYEYGTTKGK